MWSKWPVCEGIDLWIISCEQENIKCRYRSRAAPQDNKTE